MSSTNRGGKRSEADFYPTPAWAVRRLLLSSQSGPRVLLDGGSNLFLEPGAGDGVIIRTVQEIRPDLWWTAVEMRPECKPLLRCADRTVICDFLKFRPTKMRSFATALGNPPFSLATEFVEHALKFSENVVFLLRVNFLESEKRKDFFTKYGVPDVYVLSTRPSFNGGGTDSSAYAWMHWRADRQQAGRTTILYRVEGERDEQVQKTGEATAALQASKQRSEDGNTAA